MTNPTTKRPDEEETYKELAKNDNERLSEEGNKRPTNEYVLNVAFLSFLAFTILQTGFALKAKSQAMLADSEAMFVDALTYLFNLLAEHLKNKPYTKEELCMSHDERHRRRKLKRLYLELIPPLISVTTLIVVTVMALKEAFGTLFGPDGTAPNNSDQPDLSVMLFFSALNLLLDVLNVTCFAKADQAIGLPINYQDMQKLHHGITLTEKSALLEEAPHQETHGAESIKKVSSYQSTGDNSMVESTYNTACEASSEANESISTDGDFMGLINLNLNMCSAWTHVCADTLRSIAVLIAAGIAFVVKGVTPDGADATAAVIVSFIIIFSLGPLIQGLFLTACEIRTMKREERCNGSSHLGITITV